LCLYLFEVLRDGTRALCHNARIQQAALIQQQAARIEELEDRLKQQAKNTEGPREVAEQRPVDTENGSVAADPKRSPRKQGKTRTPRRRSVVGDAPIGPVDSSDAPLKPLQKSAGAVEEKRPRKKGSRKTRSLCRSIAAGAPEQLVDIAEPVSALDTAEKVVVGDAAENGVVGNLVAVAPDASTAGRQAGAGSQPANSVEALSTPAAIVSKSLVRKKKALKSRSARRSLAVWDAVLTFRLFRL
jgi:hypothetical protein